MKSVNVSTHTKEDTISSPGGSFTEAPVTQKEDRANVVYPSPLGIVITKSRSSKFPKRYLKIAKPQGVRIPRDRNTGERQLPADKSG